MTTTLVHLKHGYDQASNRLYRRDEVARTNSGSFDELYAYDGLHRLTSFDRGQLNSGNTALSSGPTLNQSWTLDSTGNWKGFTQTVQNALTQTRTHNEVNEIDGISKTVGADWPTPAFDDNGNMTNFPQPLALTDSYTAVYDAWNRLVRLTNDADDDKTVAEFEYDGLHRRTVKEVYDDGSLDYRRHYYFSDQWQVLEERVDSDTSADRQYVWGLRYVDDLVLRDHDNTRLYALTDALFNVVAITDDTGDVKERFAYQPYGESEPLNPNFSAYSGAVYEWEYRFTGRELDLETGLQLNRNRYLHQQLGRWLTRDPIAYDGADMNLYGYVGGRVTGGFDPSGLFGKLQCGKARRECYAQCEKNPGKNLSKCQSQCDQFFKNCLAVSKWPTPGSPGGLPTAVYIGGTATVGGGGGFTVVWCTDENGVTHRFVYVKICGVTGVGGSLAGGAVQGMTGKNCRIERYTGLFLEASAGEGICGEGAVSLAPKPGGGATIGEVTQIGVGIGAGLTPISVGGCYYFAIPALSD